MNPTPSVDLLARLGSGIRPDGSSSAPRSGIDQAGFADLLARVRGGSVSSDRPVEIAPGLKIELSAEQLARLGVALDAAEAAGHHRVMALIDGRALTIDVPGRMVMESHQAGEARMLSDFDAVISVPEGSLKDLQRLFSGRPSGTAHAGAHSGLDTIRNQSLAEILAASNPDSSEQSITTAANRAA